MSTTTNEASKRSQLVRKELEDFRQLHQQGSRTRRTANHRTGKNSRGRDEKSPRSTDPGTTSKRPG